MTYLSNFIISNLHNLTLLVNKCKESNKERRKTDYDKDINYKNSFIHI